MSGKIKPGEKLSSGLRRIARKEAGCLLEFPGREGGSDTFESVHRARKRIKKLRALLRLVRERLGDESYQRQMDSLRYLALALAPLRDSGVQGQTLRLFQRSLRRQLPAGEFARLQKIAASRTQVQLGLLAAREKAWTHRCQALLDEIERWKLGRLSWNDLRPSIRKSRKRFIRKFDQARKENAPDHLHGWRKCAKALACQLDVLKPLLAKSPRRFVAKLSQLGEFLGDDHDLALLEGLAQESSPLLLASVRHATQKRRAKLQQSALSLGGRLLRKKRLF